MGPHAPTPWIVQERLVLHEGQGLTLRAAAVPPRLGKESDTGPPPPGTERMEQLLGLFGIGIAILLTVSAIVILIGKRRGRR